MATTDGGTEKLVPILFDEDRALENIKLFPGSDRGLTPGQLWAEAAKMIKAALAGPLKNNPPLSGRNKSSIEAMISAK